MKYIDLLSFKQHTWLLFFHSWHILKSWQEGNRTSKSIKEVLLETLILETIRWVVDGLWPQKPKCSILGCTRKSITSLSREVTLPQCPKFITIMYKWNIMLFNFFLPYFILQHGFVPLCDENQCYIHCNMCTANCNIILKPQLLFLGLFD